MLTELMHNLELCDLAPSIRQRYGVQSEFRWVDEQGTPRAIRQGDGREQGDALMPKLFCLPLHLALTEIRRRLPPSVDIVAYLDDVYAVCSPSDAPHILHDAQTILRDACRIDVNSLPCCHTARQIIFG